MVNREMPNDIVLVAYNKYSTVIIMVTRSASRMRVSEMFWRRAAISWVCGPMGLSRNSACLELITDKNNATYQNSALAAE